MPYHKCLDEIVMEKLTDQPQTFGDVAASKETRPFIRTLKYPSIDGMRFYAAFIVFLHHTIDMTVNDTLRDAPTDSAFGLLRSFLSYAGDGQHGVELFFIISGFLMGRITLQAVKFNYFDFLKRRFLRIYPAFFVFQIAATALWCLPLAVPFTWRNALGDLFFLQIFPALHIFPYNYVTWSLGFEFLFYIILPAVIVIRRFVGARTALILLFAFAFFFLPQYLSRMHGLFVGSIVASFDDRELRMIAKRIPAWPAVIFYTAAIAAYPMMDSATFFSFVLLPCMILFIKIVFDEDSRLHGIFATRPMRALGTVSYSFYLCHVIVLFAVLIFIINPLGLGNPAYKIPIFFGLGLLLTILVAGGSYFLIERPYFVRNRHSALALRSAC